MTSKHFTYHLKQLKKFELIEKDETAYALTTEGKKYVERLDEADMKLEKQPKVSVALCVERTTETGEVQLLLSKHLKQPNYGKVVGIGGKVRFGETFEETARRELKEETGLTGDFEMTNIVRKIGYQVDPKNSHEVVLDVVFVFFHVTNVQGEFITKIADQENFWCNVADIAQRTDISETLIEFMNKGRTGKMKSFEVISEMEGY